MSINKNLKKIVLCLFFIVSGGVMGGLVMNFYCARNFERFLLHGQVYDITASMAILRSLNDDDLVSAQKSLNIFLNNKFRVAIPLILKNKDISRLKNYSPEVNEWYERFLQNENGVIHGN